MEVRLERWGEEGMSGRDINDETPDGNIAQDDGEWLCFCGNRPDLTGFHRNKTPYATQMKRIFLIRSGK